MKTRFQRTLVWLLSAAMAFGMLAGCTKKDDDTQESEQPSDPAAELAIKYAKNFSIQYLDDDVKIVTDSDGRDLLLVPSEADVPSGHDDCILIRTPLTHAFYGSTTHVGYMGFFGKDSLYDSIAAVATEQARWTTPQVLERFESGQIQYIAAASGMSLPDAETVLDLNPDVYFTVAYPGQDRLTQYEDVGITYVSVGEWMESSSYAAMEWVKFFGAFYNEDELADQIFETKYAEMEEMRLMCADIPATERPVVAFGLVSSGVIYTRASDSSTALEVESAGGTYYVDDLFGEGSLRIGMEEFFVNAKDADIIIYTSMLSYTPDKAALLEIEPLFAETKAFQNDQIYVYADDYYMNSAAVDVKYADLVTIIHPELMPDHELQMIVKLP